MMRWPKRDLQNDFLGMKWREIIGLLLCGLAILLHFAGAHSWHP
jgi:hypothetical protein